MSGLWRQTARLRSAWDICGACIGVGMGRFGEQWSFVVLGAFAVASSGFFVVASW